MLTNSQIAGLQAFHDYTRGTCSPWDLTGNHRARERQYVLQMVTGTKAPRAQCGVTAIRSVLFDLLGITGACNSDKEDNLRAAILPLVDTGRAAALATFASVMPGWKFS